MKKILAIFLSVFLFLLLVPPMLVRGQSSNSYSVSGYVFDDKNANGVQDGGEVGISNMKVYADNTYNQYSITDQTGYFRIDNLPTGSHSIEIANAGEQGSKPTTSEKFSVTSPRGDIRFGVQKGGYDVQGCVVDSNGNRVRGAKVYVDFPSREATYTNSFGCYRIEDVGYDSSTPVYGVSGGHNIYVEGYDANPVLVNPQTPTTYQNANFTVRSNQDNICIQVVTPARNPSTGQCINFPTPCEVPAGWIPWGCQYQDPGSGQCSAGPIGTPTYRCNNSNQYCTVTRYQRSDCTPYEQTTNCQSIPGYCNYQQPSQPSPSYGNPYCQGSVNPSSGSVPFNSTISATFYNGGNPNLYPNYYAFRINGIGHESSTSASNYSFSWPFNSVGSHQVNLSLQHSGGTVNCSTTVNATQYGNLYSDQTSQLQQYQPQPSQTWPEPNQTLPEPANDSYSNLYSVGDTQPLPDQNPTYWDNSASSWSDYDYAQDPYNVYGNYNYNYQDVYDPGYSGYNDQVYYDTSSYSESGYMDNGWY